MKIPLISPLALIGLTLAAAAGAAEIPKLPVGMNLAGIGGYQGICI